MLHKNDGKRDPFAICTIFKSRLADNGDIRHLRNAWRRGEVLKNITAKVGKIIDVTKLWKSAKKFLYTNTSLKTVTVIVKNMIIAEL